MEPSFDGIENDSGGQARHRPFTGGISHIAAEGGHFLGVGQ